MNKCKAANCDRGARARGLCLRHYKAERRLTAKTARGQAGFGLPAWATSADVAYAAGYIDADGTITVALTKSASTRHGIGFYPHISAVSIDVESVTFLLNLFRGGKIVTRERLTGNLKSRYPIHTWYVGGERACWIAAQMAPHLKIKREQAESLAKFYEERLWSQSREQNAMPEEEFQRRMELVRLIRERNQRAYLEEIA